MEGEGHVSNGETHIQKAGNMRKSELKGIWLPTARLDNVGCGMEVEIKEIRFPWKLSGFHRTENERERASE